ncbi:MAG: hypothetical protein ACE5KE_00365 [Methanosarcinales archaeon]
MNEEEIHEAGAYLVKCLNKLNKEKRKELLFASVGALIGLTDLNKEDKIRIIREVLKYFEKENPKYIG